jgi:hypothetical protein
MNKITESFLQAVAGDIEKMVLENQEQMDFAFQKLDGEMKVSIAVNMDRSADGIVVSYDLAFDLEPKPEPTVRHKVKYKHVINEGQAAMEFLGKEMAEGRLSVVRGNQ